MTVDDGNSRTGTDPDATRFRPGADPLGSHVHQTQNGPKRGEWPNQKFPKL